MTAPDVFGRVADLLLFGGSAAAVPADPRLDADIRRLLDELGVVDPEALLAPDRPGEETQA